MQDSDFDVLMSEIYTLREQVGELNCKVHDLEQENEDIMRELQWFYDKVDGQFSAINNELCETRNIVHEHCNSFHSMLVLGGKKDEDNIS